MERLTNGDALRSIDAIVNIKEKRIRCLVLILSNNLGKRGKLSFEGSEVSYNEDEHIPCPSKSLVYVMSLERAISTESDLV